MAEVSPTTTAAKEQMAKQNEARQKSQEKAVKSMEGVKPTPTQEENDLAKMGVDVVNKEPDGSPEEGAPPEPPPEGTPVSRTAPQSRQTTPASKPPASGSSSS